MPVCDGVVVRYLFGLVGADPVRAVDYRLVQCGEYGLSVDSDVLVYWFLYTWCKVLCTGK